MRHLLRAQPHDDCRSRGAQRDGECGLRCDRRGRRRPRLRVRGRIARPARTHDSRRAGESRNRERRRRTALRGVRDPRVAVCVRRQRLGVRRRNRLLRFRRGARGVPLRVERSDCRQLGGGRRPLFEELIARLESLHVRLQYRVLPDASRRWRRSLLRRLVPWRRRIARSRRTAPEPAEAACTPTIRISRL